MGIAIYLENQIHGRTYAGTDASSQLARILDVANSKGLLGGIDIHGDTMFNMVQLEQLKKELDAIVLDHPEVESDASSLKVLIHRAIKGRGYIWLSGD